MNRISAIRIVQKGLGEKNNGGFIVYVATMTLAQLRGHVKVDMWSPSNPDGYQRPLVDRRLKDLARYVQEEEGILPTSILVGVRPDDEPKIEPVGFDGNGVSMGELAFPEGAALWVIDGQHRYFGVNYAYERGVTDLESYPFPICIMWDIDRYAEMIHFNIINTRQRKMSTDIVDRHLVQIKKVMGTDMIAAGPRGEKEYIRAVATEVTDMLNDEPGVWQHQIAIPGVPGRDRGLIRQHTMVVSIEPFLKDPWVRARSNDQKVKVLVNFWAAAKEAWPEAFDSPKEYRVQATVGVYSLHLVLPVIVHRCLEGRDLSKDRMLALLEEIGISSDFWHKEDGDPRTLGTGMASMRALSHFLVEQLPESGESEVKL